MDYSDGFIKIFAEETGDGLKSKEKYRLPKRWDGKDFCRTIYAFFEEYKKDVITRFPEMEHEIKLITRNLYTSLVKSYQGLSQESFAYFEKAMAFLEDDPLLFEIEIQSDLKLYRVVDAGSTELPDRSRIFHVPFSMRSKMATQRFSIPGFPGLYLGSSLELCCAEIGKDITCPTAIASEFEFYQDGFKDNDTQLKIYDISISPNRIFDEARLYTMNEDIYLRWYPLIAACSFIRAHKNDPYASEYVFSQHFMQWIRMQDSYSITGVKYFSCSTERASDMGDNFAFPTTGVPYQIRGTKSEYDFLLSNCLKLTKPRFLNEFSSYEECESKLSNDKKESLSKNTESLGIKSFTIPEGEIEIGYAAFAHCTDLTEITIPESVVSIGDGAFSHCSSLTKIVIPDSVTSIGNFAFYDCSSLTDIVVPDSVTSIGDGAFEDCSSLTEISIPSSVTSIGNFLFSRCGSLTKIVIPDSVTSIEKDAFLQCSNLTEIVIPGSVTSIGDDAFVQCSSLTKIVIPDGVTSIGDGAFNDCSNLTEIIIPDSVTSIGDGAFDDCSSLKKIVIPDSVTSIGWFAFYGCSGLTEIVIPDGVTSIENEVFSHCSSLMAIVISGSVTSIGDGAFFQCSSLTRIVIPDGVTSIGKEAFSYCSSLMAIVIPDSVTSIGDGAFDNCSSLTEIFIPSSVTSIGWFAFYDCSGLTEIIIPENVAFIGDNALVGCANCKITIDDENPVYYCRDNCIYERGTDRMVSSTDE